MGNRLSKWFKQAIVKMIYHKYEKDYRQVGDYCVREIYPHVYRLMNAGVHSELFVGSERALLLDTGNGYADLPSVIREITSLPLTVVNSHGHLDHTCGNYQFEQEIYIHPDDMELCRLHNSPKIRSQSAQMAMGLRGTKGVMGGVPADFDTDAYIHQGCGNLVPLQEGQVFDLGGISLEVISLPGHSIGSIGLLYRERKILYAGDAINSNVLLCFDYSAPLSVYRKTLEKATKLDFEEMIISHWFYPIPKERLELYQKATENPDYEHGIPYESYLLPDGADARQCIIDGKTPRDVLKPGFAAVTVTRETLR